MYVTKRRGGEAYPDGVAGGVAAAAAFRNRNIAALTVLSAPFTPAGTSNIAAVLFTPKVSGILQISAMILLENGVAADTYALIAEILPGTNLTVSGGEATSGGWVMGTNTPPTIGGTPSPTTFALEGIDALAVSDFGSLLVFGYSPPQPIGVSLIVAVNLGEVGSGHALASVDVANLSVLELP